MGVQKVILTRTMDGSSAATLSNANPPVEGTKTLQGGVGTLALGKPGDIVSRAFGPLTYGEIAGETPVEFGTFVAGKGILVNSNDVPFYNTTADANGVVNPFGTTNVAMPGQAVSFMVYGTAIVKNSALAGIMAGMNARVVTPGYDAEAEYADGEVFEVEVTGFKAAAAATTEPPAGEESPEAGS